MKPKIKNPNKTLYAILLGFLEYTVMFLAILNFYTPYMQLGIGKYIINYGCTIVFFLLVIGKKYLKFDSILLFYMIGAFIPFLNVSRENISGYIGEFLILVPLCYMYITSSFKNNNVNSFFCKYSNIVIIIAIISLFFWLFGTMLGIVKPTAYIPHEWGGFRRIPMYYGVYFETQEAFVTVETQSTIRNSGIFSEAPMYNMILCTALGVELFIRDKKSMWRIILLIITILTTISTTGAIYLVLVFSYILYSYAGSKFKTFIIFILPLLLIVTLLMTQYVLDNKKQTGEGSYNSRVNDIENCIEIGMSNPMFGVGLYSENTTYGVNKWGYSNSLFTIFARGGLYMLALYFFCLFAVPGIVYNNYRKISVFILSYALLFTFTIAYFNILSFFFLALGLGLWKQNLIMQK